MNKAENEYTPHPTIWVILWYEPKPPWRSMSVFATRTKAEESLNLMGPKYSGRIVKYKQA